MLKFRTVIFLLLGLFSISVLGREAIAATYDWKFSGWYGGGCYTNVEFDPQTKGRVYLASDVAGIWRSDDNGDHWRFVTEGLGNLIVAQIAISPKLSSVVYAATKRGIFYSTDAGEKWVKSNDLRGRMTFERPTNYRSVSLDPDRPESLCVGTAKGEVFCSENFGRDWTHLPNAKLARSAQPITALQHLPDHSGLLAATKEGVFQYSFSKALWFAADPALEKVTDLIPVNETFMAAANGELWKFNIANSSWKPAYGLHPGKIYRLAFDEVGSRLYAAWNQDWSGGIITSLDQGKSWKNISGNMKVDIAANPTRRWFAQNTKITSLKINPLINNILMVTDWWGVWRTDNYGAIWQEKIIGAPNTVGSDLIFSPDGALYSATMDNGLLKSSDFGETYKPLFPSRGYDAGINGHVWRVGVLKNDRIIATSSPWNEQVNRVALSDDGGNSFRIIRDGLPTSRPKVNTVWGEGYPRALAIDTRDKNLVYLGIDGDDGGGLFISRDGGETWSRSEGQPGSLRIYNGLAVDPTSPEIIYWGATGQKGGVYRSTNRGKTWEHVFNGAKWIFDIHVAKDGSVYAAGDQNGASLFTSRDRGKTWTKVGAFANAATAEAITTDPLDPATIAVSTQSWSGEGQKATFLSRDAGATWIDVTGNLPPGAGAAAMIFSPDGRYLYMSRYAGGIYRLNLR